MTGSRRSVALVALAMVLALLAVTVIGFLLRWHAWVPIEISGVVLRDDADPGKQMPIPDALVTVTAGREKATAASDELGYFHFKLGFSLQPNRKLKMTFQRKGYQPLDLVRDPFGPLLLARLQPLERGRLQDAVARPVEVLVRHVSVSYSIKATTTVDIGGAAEIFAAAGAPSLPCDPGGACSPDGKWKAISTSRLFDAGNGNVFRDTRLSCLAGPCPFTKVLEKAAIDDGRHLRVTVLNWSDPTTFLFEADVTHTSMSNIVRQAYPAIFGPSMHFTLPVSAEGPSIRAQMNAMEIVFPLGPELRLSWAVCHASAMADGTQFRCELKPGYEFR